MSITYKKAISLVCIAVIFNFVLFQFNDVASVVSYISSMFFPLVLGIAFAFITSIPMSFFEKHLTKIIKNKKRLRGISILLSALSIIATFSLLIGLIVPQLIENVTALFDSIPTMYDNFMAWVSKNESIIPADIVSFLNSSNWGEILQTFGETIELNTRVIFDSMVSALGSVANIVINTIIGLALSLYFLTDKENIKLHSRRFVNIYLAKHSEKIISTTKLTIQTFRNFVTGQCLEAVILSALCMVGMTVLDLPYATMIGTLVGLTSLLPIVGGFIGAGLGAVIILITNPIQSLIFLVFVIVLQQIEGIFIYPRVVGDRIGIPAMFVLLSISIGGYIAGVIGIFLAVPIFGVIYTLFKQDMKNKELIIKNNKLGEIN